jgi:hypothetical protein
MDDATLAYRSATICALLGVVGTAMGVVGFWNISDTRLRIVQVVGIAVNGAGLIVLRALRPPYSRRLSNALFLLVLVPTVVMAWMVDEARAEHSARWVPFEPHKLSALTLAMIAPPGWAPGVVGILLFIGSAVVHDAVLPDSLRARMSAGEPFGVIAYGAFALVLLGFRQRSHAVIKELEHERREKLVLERVARVAMALRDLANTPVQTLELVRQALLGPSPRLRVQADRMRRALARLRRLNDILLPYQNAVPSDGDDRALECALDPRADVRGENDSRSGAPSRARPAPRRPA